MIHPPAHNRFVCVLLDFINNKICIWSLSNLHSWLPFSLSSLCHPPTSICLFLFQIRGGGGVVVEAEVLSIVLVPRYLSLFICWCWFWCWVGRVGWRLSANNLFSHSSSSSSYCKFFLRISPFDSMWPVIHFCSSGPNPPVFSFYFISCLPLHSDLTPRDPQTWLFLSSNALSAHAVWSRFGSNFLGHLHQRAEELKKCCSWSEWAPNWFLEHQETQNLILYIYIYTYFHAFHRGEIGSCSLSW